MHSVPYLCSTQTANFMREHSSRLIRMPAWSFSGWKISANSSELKPCHDPWAPSTGALCCAPAEQAISNTAQPVSNAMKVGTSADFDPRLRCLVSIKGKVNLIRRVRTAAMHGIAFEKLTVVKRRSSLRRCKIEANERSH